MVRLNRLSLDGLAHLQSMGLIDSDQQRARLGSSELAEIHPERAITVVIPVLNRRRKLNAALESIVSQSRLPCEIVIVDDGSNPSIASDDFASFPVPTRVVSHGKTLGGAAARNTGVRTAQTEWVAFLDSDDVWLPRRLERQVEALGSRHEQIDVVVSNVLLREPGEVDVPINRRALTPNDDISRYLMVEGCALHSSSLLVRRATLLNVPFDEQLSKHQDWDLLLRLHAASAAILYLHEPLAVYCADRDGDRISERERNVQVSLRWMNKNRELLAPDAVAYYYACHCLPRAVREAPSAALLRFFHYASRSPGASHAAVRGLGRLLEAFVVRRISAMRSER